MFSKLKILGIALLTPVIVYAVFLLGIMFLLWIPYEATLHIQYWSSDLRAALAAAVLVCWICTGLFVD